MACVTVRPKAVLLVRVPDAPLIVRVTFPGAAVTLAVKVNVLFELVGFGVNAAVTPRGRFDTESFTLPLNPPCGMMTIALVPLVPCVMVRAVGVEESVKLGVGAGQLFTKLAALSVPIPVAKSQPVVLA